VIQKLIIIAGEPQWIEVQYISAVGLYQIENKETIWFIYDLEPIDDYEKISDAIYNIKSQWIRNKKIEEVLKK